MHQLDRCEYDVAPDRSRGHATITVSTRFVPGDQPDVFLALPILVAICCTDLPNNVLHIPQHNASFIGYPQVGTRIQFQYKTTVIQGVQVYKKYMLMF
jgi:hypothetical protein